MNPLENMMGGDDGLNLYSIIINVAFGFVLGLIVFVGFGEVLTYGAKLAGDLIKLSGYGQQMTAFGIATTAAPYVVLAPLGALVAKQLSSVRSVKGFAFFAAAVLVGMVGAYFGHASLGI